MYVCSREKLSSYGDIRRKAIDIENACIQADVRPNQEGCAMYVIISKRETKIQWVWTGIEKEVKSIVENMVELDPSETLDEIYQKMVKHGLHDAIADAFIEFVTVDAPDEYGILYFDEIPEHILESVVDATYDEMREAEEEEE